MHLPDMVCIRALANNAPEKTAIRDCVMERMTAMKNVLSPTSENMMADMDAANDRMNGDMLYFTSNLKNIDLMITCDSKMILAAS